MANLRVRWTYTHHLNSKSTVDRTKTGTYYGKVRHTVKYKGADQLAYVQFDGNKRVSFVPYDDLVFDSIPKKNTI